MEEACQKPHREVGDDPSDDAANGELGADAVTEMAEQVGQLVYAGSEE